ncbi:hypothetical protein [Glutamicibacter sp.]|uniref:hypothetical protein n=1 Tax=Glutamicibacter sp. TaxID=1931995 RepID=UPI0028BF03A2|nr:hypothetical protein [Glutamicibacter sp.]
MSMPIEARRLNGTDLGKELANYGVLQSVGHAEETFEETTFGDRKKRTHKLKLVRIVTERGEFGLIPSTLITITGKPSPKPGDTE